MPGRVALVTDSTAMLPAGVAERPAITVVPLKVVIGAKSYDEGIDPEATPAAIATALREWSPVSTSRPSPQAFLEAYCRARDEGFDEVVSVHLSGQVSGTYESAQLAAREAPLPVRPVDTGQLGMAVGYAVAAAAQVLDRGGSAQDAAAGALGRAGRTTSLFYVDTLEYLRRGGRIGVTATLIGSALAVKPLLTVTDGRIVPLEKVRTAAKALSRLEERAANAAGREPVDVAVAHLASPDRAAGLAANLATRLAGNLDGREVSLGEVGAVIGAHVGPGMVAVVVAPR